jgi:hypothetical protein
VCATDLFADENRAKAVGGLLGLRSEIERVCDLEKWAMGEHFGQVCACAIEHEIRKLSGCEYVSERHQNLFSLGVTSDFKPTFYFFLQVLDAAWVG